MRANAYELVVALDRRSTRNHPDVVFIPQEVNEALWSAGVWTRMNAEHGTRFDIAEEQDIDPEQGRWLADLLLEAADNMSSESAAVTREAAALLHRVGAEGADVIVAL